MFVVWYSDSATLVLKIDYYTTNANDFVVLYTFFFNSRTFVYSYRYNVTNVQFLILHRFRYSNSKRANRTEVVFSKSYFGARTSLLKLTSDHALFGRTYSNYLYNILLSRSLFIGAYIARVTDGRRVRRRRDVRCRFDLGVAWFIRSYRNTSFMRVHIKTIERGCFPIMLFRRSCVCVCVCVCTRGEYTAKLLYIWRKDLYGGL